MNLNAIIAQPKSGEEKFRFNEGNIDFKLNEFWKWNQSNLLENRTRGILAEFIVKQALNIDNNIRVEWDSYDLITKEGIKIEVKSAAYIQSWIQKKYSDISFGIAPAKMDPIHPLYDGTSKRWSDLYIFCVLENKDQETINPLNLNQWVFYVLKTEILDLKVPNQKTIGLNSLLKLQPAKCNFNELKTAILS
tara:strand:- start:326 stop:901 length:576 start_codon:yes stop_codon:yes gene_type:complete